ncbi:MAG TPA: TIGR03790 family protein [Bryobacteraceae bacterium]|nr:TIGR03790 family protein [Bryobacteraceae bacterium]
MNLITALLAESLVCALLAAPVPKHGPASVMVVVNAKSEASRSIGEYYAKVRRIPRGNICQIVATSEETITRLAFEAEVRRPIETCLRERGLAERIHFLVTTLGVPLRINGSDGLKGDYAAVDSELTLLYAHMKGQKVPTAGPLPNPVFRRTALPFVHPGVPLYLVTRLAAYDTAGAKALVDRCGEARNRGVVVLDAKDSGDEPGDSWLRNAAIALPSSRVVFEETTNLLPARGSVIGYASWGSNDQARRTRKTGFQFLPGALLTEFVSTNARTFQRPPANWIVGSWKNKDSWFMGTPQTLIGDYIEEGITGTTGHTWEPYLQFTARPDILFPAWLSGRNLAEAFWVSIPAVSWQNIVIGDPLCSLPQG